jgi:hypothetical protein
VKGGPSMVDNELITKCAKLARDGIGTSQLADTGVPPVAPDADGSAAGSSN